MSKAIDIILPVHNEAGSLLQLHKDLQQLGKKLGKAYILRFIFVNDGSLDDSEKVLRRLSRQDNRVTVLNLSRNFGHQLALTAGLDYYRADAVITMDSDLQHPPAVCIKLIEKWEQGYQVVYAKRRTRKDDDLFKRFASRLFYFLINRFSDTNIPNDVADFRLMDRRVADALKGFREHHRFLRGMVSYLGFKTTTVDFDQRSRRYGGTSYPRRKMFGFAADAITGFSAAPLRAIAKLGFGIALLSLAGICYAIGVKLLSPAHAVPGWAFISVAVLFIGGIQITMLGILGSYIGRIYTQSQNRPLYIFSSIIKPRKKS